MAPLTSLRALLGPGTLVASIALALSTPLAAILHGDAEFTVERACITAALAVVGIALGLYLRRAVLRLIDRFEAAQRAESLRFTTAIENISQGLCFFDGGHRLIVCNRRYAQMYDLSNDMVRPGTTLRDVVDARFEVGSFPAMKRDAYLAWRETIAVSNTPSDTEVTLRNGKTFAIHHEPMPDGGWVATHEDITVRKQALEQVARMAHHDALTDLPNRVRFRERLHAVIATAPPDSAVAVLCLDLDRFKAVNDTLGHPVGDELLRQVARRLQECVRQDDLLARLGGDEFAIIQSGAPQPAAGEALAARLVDVMGRPFDVRGHRLQIGTSVGVALWPRDGADPDQLLSHADLALYDAKGSGRGEHRFFCPTLSEKAQSRRALEGDLRRACGQGEFELHFQPILSLKGSIVERRVVAFEALVRWRHPRLGLLMPDTFIALAEETGLIEPIGDWVLEHALREASLWPSDVGVAVNLSPQQLKSGRIVATVRDALERSGCAAHRLELEITESVLLADDSANVALLHAVRDLGVRISLDDFGTGYSSLSYLRSFPFDKIKIDRSFVAGVASNDTEAAIVRAITSMGESLGMTVTAEGVETEEQLRAVRRLGCIEAQGYLFGRPRPVADVDEVLRGGPRLALVS